LSSSRRSYSGRRSSVFSPLDFFFICLSLFTGKLPCTDDTDSLATVGVSYHEQPAATRESEGDEPIFLLGMIRIEDSDAQRVPANTSSLSERNAVFSQIHSCFGWVPFELYHALSHICRGTGCSGAARFYAVLCSSEVRALRSLIQFFKREVIHFEPLG